MKNFITLLLITLSGYCFSQSSYTLDTDNIDPVSMTKVTWVITVVDTLSDEASIIIPADTLIVEEDTTITPADTIATTDTITITLPNELGDGYVGWFSVQLDTIADYEAFEFQGAYKIEQAACLGCRWESADDGTITGADNLIYGSGDPATEVFPVRGTRLRLYFTQSATGTVIFTAYLVLKASSISDQ